MFVVAVLQVLSIASPRQYSFCCRVGVSLSCHAVAIDHTVKGAVGTCLLCAFIAAVHVLATHLVLRTSVRMLVCYKCHLNQGAILQVKPSLVRHLSGGRGHWPGSVWRRQGPRELA